MNDAKTLAVFVFAFILLSALVIKMDGSTQAILGALVLLFLMCKKNKSGFESSCQEDAEPTPVGAPLEPNTMPIPGADPAVLEKLWADQRPAEPVWSNSNEEKIKSSNKIAVNSVFGRRSGGTIDNALYKHKQRIGDRDRQATINQIRSRRNNVYEPYYRQELAEAERSHGWWGQNDDILTTKLDRRQLNTIDMGRFNNPDQDLDGIYSA